MKFRQHKCYILPTSSGVISLIVCFTAVLISLSFANPLAISASFFLLLCVLLSAVITDHTLRKLSLLSLPKCQYLFAQRTTCLPLTVCLQLSDKIDMQGCDYSLHFSINNHRHIFPITFTSDDRQVIPLALTVKNRGIERIDHLHIETTYPYGLFRSWKTLPCQCDLIIAPALEGKAALPENQRLTHQEPFFHHRSSHQEEVYDSHRLYQHGDSWRRIDWIRHNRENILLTKNFKSYIQPSYSFSFNSSDKSEEQREKELSQLCVWISRCANQGDSFALSLDHHRLDTGKGQEQLQRAMRMLASYQPGIVQ